MSSNLEFGQIYRYRILSLLGQSGNNEVFEAHDPVLDQPIRIYRWTPPPGELDTSLARLDSALPRIRDLSVDAFSGDGALCLAAAGSGDVRAALTVLRDGGLFPGDWPGLIAKPEPPPVPAPAPPPPPPPPPPVPTPSPRRPQPLRAKPAAPPAKRSGWFWKLALSAIAIAIAFAPRWLKQDTVTPAPSVYKPPVTTTLPPPAPTPAPAQHPIRQAPHHAPSAHVRPSFNCAAARTANELLICRDNHLAQLDVRMVAAYRQALAGLTPESRRQVQQWHLKWFIDYSRTCNSRPDDQQRATCIAGFLTQHTAKLREVNGR